MFNLHALKYREGVISILCSTDVKPQKKSIYQLCMWAPLRCPYDIYKKMPKWKVNNGVVLLDYTQILIDRKKVKLGISDDDLLSREDVTEAIITGGKARLRPVLLTAITTVLGLIPLAIGLNINFVSLFSDFDPQIYMGGDNVIFWGPLAWTVIFGLVVATFLTLIIVPVLFNISYRLKIRIRRWTSKHETPEVVTE